MDVTVKEKYLSWGASFGIHFCIIAVAAAMGLFSMATETEKRPIDVVIYDASAPESAPEPAAEAAAPMPSIDDIPLCLLFLRRLERVLHSDCSCGDGTFLDGDGDGETSDRR